MSDRGFPLVPHFIVRYQAVINGFLVQPVFAFQGGIANFQFIGDFQQVIKAGICTIQA